MTHIDDAALAGQAMGDAWALTPQQRAHLDTCGQCRRTLDELRDTHLLAAARTELSVPSPTVWRRVQDEIGPTAAVTPIRRPPRTGRRPILMAAVAAVIGVVAGVVGTVVVTNSGAGDHVVESVTLRALPGKAGHGSAELIDKGGARYVRVSVDLPSSRDAFHELWLINTDGRRMQDLGVLPPSGHGDYPLPKELQSDLHGYTTVDVSIEPFDGNPAHSHNSAVRGQLAG